MRTIALLIVLVVLATSSPAEAVRRPVNEGGDTQACMTKAEWEAVGLNMRRGRVERIVDSKGHRVSPRRMQAVDALAESQGLAAQHPKLRDVRAWPVCDETNTSFYFALVEFKANHRHSRNDRVQSTYISEGAS